MHTFECERLPFLTRQQKQLTHSHSLILVFSIMCAVLCICFLPCLSSSSSHLIRFIQFVSFQLRAAELTSVALPISITHSSRVRLHYSLSRPLDINMHMAAAHREDDAADRSLGYDTIVCSPSLQTSEVRRREKVPSLAPSAVIFILLLLLLLLLSPLHRTPSRLISLCSHSLSSSGCNSISLITHHTTQHTPISVT